MILTIGSGSPHLILASHYDTMPPGDLNAWRSDPYTLTRSDGMLYGLGAADMKAGIAAMLVAAARVAASGFPGTLTLVFAADEENCSGDGMRWLAEEGLLAADAGVVVEPSSVSERSWEKLYVAQRGSCLAWLDARGVPGHSGTVMDAGARASAVFGRAIPALIESQPLSDRRHPVDGTPVTVNVATMVEGGMVPFAHPAALRAAIDVRTIEGLTEEEVLEALRRPIAEAGLAERVTIEPTEPPWNWFPPGETARDERLLNAAVGAWREVLGQEPEQAVLTAGTDSSWLNAAGIPALPAFGPGSLGVAHKPNEWLPEQDVITSVALFESLILRYLEGDTREPR